MKILRLRISLEGSDPEIWRRFQLTDEMTLLDLHNVVQIVMGWTDSHLHEFEIKGKRYCLRFPNDDFYGDPPIDEGTVRLGDVLKRVRQKVQYIYDMGDGWQHTLVVEERVESASGFPHPVCLAGERACPPEDCGGIWGYYQMLEAVRDPEHDEHETYLEWLSPDFDRDHFDLREVNGILKRYDEYVSGLDEDE